jgi:hypothetical protein
VVPVSARPGRVSALRSLLRARARDEYSLMPARYFVEHWWAWVAVERWPALAARLRDCGRIVAESADRNARRLPRSARSCAGRSRDYRDDVVLVVRVQHLGVI